MTTAIHPTAIVDPDAELGDGVEIGPWAMIGPRVTVGDRCRIGPRARLQQNVRPEIQIRVDVRTAEMGENRHEVVIDINIDARAGDAPAINMRHIALRRTRTPWWRSVRVMAHLLQKGRSGGSMWGPEAPAGRPRWPS